VLECRHELPAGSEMHHFGIKANVTEEKAARQAAVCAAALASSSNAVEISRMLITPIRL